MKKKLKELLIPQHKSKIQAGKGLAEGKYKFFTSSPLQTKYYNNAEFKKPALIFGTGGNASVHYCGKPFATSTDCLVMYGKPDVNLELIYHYLLSNIYVLEAGFKGAGLQHISKDYILDIEIDFPDSKEQANIVEQMREIDRITCNYDEQLICLNNITKSRFIELFGNPKLNNMRWKTGIVSEYYTVKGGKRIPKGMNYANTVTSHPYLRATDMKNETIVEDDIHYIDDDVFQHIKKYTVNGGDIYLTNVGVHLGMAGVIPDKFDGANLTENAVKLVPKTKGTIDGLFLAHYINSPEIQEYIDERKMTVGVPKLAIFRIETIPLIIPPIEIQKKFLDFAKQVDKSKLAIQKSLEKLEILKKSLMQKYFG